VDATDPKESGEFSVVGQPETARAREIQQQVPAERWVRLVREATERANILEMLWKEQEAHSLSMQECVRQKAPEVGWSAYQRWKRKAESLEGPLWERLLDQRLPPPPKVIDEEIRLAACMLRRADRAMGPGAAREHLQAQFGPRGKVSNASLKRIWAAADLRWEPPADRKGQVPGEQVVHYGGGGGLALVGAAELELGTSSKLAGAALESGRQRAASQAPVMVRPEPLDARDEKGRFTSQYNEYWREGVEPGQSDPRWTSDEMKRGQRPLGDLQLLGLGRSYLSARLLCMATTPLLTERRGFVGLAGPAGSWLELLGVRAYMPRTLDKALTQLGLLDVGEALWEVHAQNWHEQAQRWSEGGESWLQSAVYVDATQDPYWTRKFAQSGKVSRVGRVMPCLSRVAITGGPGVPLVVETHAGTVQLKKRLVPLLRKLEGWVGPGELGRLTIIDAEMATGNLLWTLYHELDRLFVSVLKGATLAGAEQRIFGDWQLFRHHDELRELEVVLQGKDLPAEGFTMRGVEMRRTGSRRPASTIFVTPATPEELSTDEVASAYLSRWPHQEQLFRNARNGGGLNRSHGYGGQYVVNVALGEKIEKAEKKRWRAQDHLVDALELSESVSTDTIGEKVNRQVKTAQRVVKKAEKDFERSHNKLVDQCTMPREIYARDPSRDNIMSCLKLNALMLLEFVLKEYFGDLRIQWRTYIEELMALAVTVRTSRSRILYEIHENRRNPAFMEHLRTACAEINRRRLHRDKRLLVFRVVESTPGGS
jgi:hypothetical protein